MATFESKVHALQIEPHPNADRLELAAIGGFRCVVGKGTFVNGDLAAYIPEGAICPDWLIEKLGLEGKLAGSKKNRVKAVKLRGALSQGLVCPVEDGKIRDHEVSLGDTVTELLEIVKYEPPIPFAMQGQVLPLHGATIRYDIENIKKFPDEFEENEPVVMTEKLHGTWCCMGWHPDHGHMVSSKGMADKGLGLALNEENEHNLYVMTFRAHEEAFETARERRGTPDAPFYILGEVHGKGVQDLHYAEPKPFFRVFDVYVGQPGQGKYLRHDQVESLLQGLFPLVPLVYRGPFSTKTLLEMTDGRSMLGGNLREGLVVKPAIERESFEFGRVILKSVSGAYLTRRGGTEYN